MATASQRRWSSATDGDVETIAAGRLQKTVVTARPVSKTGSEIGCLTLKRKKGESITIDGCIKIHVVEVKGGHVRIRISAPRDRAILRDELLHTVEA